jgi:hypothetical protein
MWNKQQAKRKRNSENEERKKEKALSKAAKTSEKALATAGKKRRDDLRKSLPPQTATNRLVQYNRILRSYVTLG